MEPLQAALACAAATIPEGFVGLLEPCPREDAEKATKIRSQLKRTLGRAWAAVVLTSYREAILRTPGGRQRFIVNSEGKTMRLAIGRA